MKDNKEKTALNYEDSGVSVSKGDAFVESIKPLASSTTRRGHIGEIGGFGGLFDIGALGFEDPIMVAATDGVGTKLLLAIEEETFAGLISSVLNLLPWVPRFMYIKNLPFSDNPCSPPIAILSG